MFKPNDLVSVTGDSTELGLEDYNVRVSTIAVVEKVLEDACVVCLNEIDGDHHVTCIIKNQYLHPIEPHDEDDKAIQIWVIWVCATCETDEHGLTQHGANRTWGFYKDRETAVKALHENWTDMWEYLYNYAVLECYDEGISHCVLESVQWFKFDREQHGYREIDMPEHERHYCSYGLG